MAENRSFTERWTEEIRRTADRRKLSRTERKLLPSVGRDGMLCPVVDQEAHNWILGLLVTRDARKPSEVYRQHLSGLMEVCVPKELREEFYYALDEMNRFQMTNGLYRRSLRSESYTPFIDAGVRLLWAYARLRCYGTDLADVLLGNVPPEIGKDCRDEHFCYAGMLAAQIDRGNTKTIEAVRAVLQGEQNTLMISYELIRGIVMSRSEQLYKELGEFLLAARLQEGVRQAVCETMDAGRAEAFLSLFQVIEEHDLIRYSSVKRAVSTWIGVYETGSMERISPKLVRLMGQCLRDPKVCDEQLASEDSVGICCALWAKGFYDAEAAVQAIRDLTEHGTKNQILIASYYMGSLQSTQLRQKAAKKVWFAYPGDLEVAAAYLVYVLGGDALDLMGSLMDYSSSGCYRYGYAPSYDKGTAPKMMTAEKLQMTRDEVFRSYELLKEMLGRLPKKGIELHPCMLPSYYRVRLTRSELAASMCLLAWVLQEDALLDEAAGVIGLIGNGRHLAARLLLHRPASDIRRAVLFDLLKNPEENTRNTACRLVERLSITKEEFQKIESLMRYKKGRPQTLKLLKRQEPAELRACIGRLLEEKSEESHMGALELSLHLKKQNPGEYQKLVPVLEAFDQPTEKEQLLLQELIDREDQVQKLLNTPGYGFYNTKKEWVIPEVRVDTAEAKELFRYGEEACILVLQRLDQLIGEHKEEEYRDFRGEELLLGVKLIRNPYSKDPAQDLPLWELWTDFYEREIQTPELLLEVCLYQQCLYREKEYRSIRGLCREVFGRVPYERLVQGQTYPEQIRTVTEALFEHYVPEELKGHWGLTGSARLQEVLEGPMRAYMAEQKTKPWRSQGQVLTKHMDAPIFRELTRWLSFAPGEQFASAFALRFRMRPEISDCVQAYARGIWGKDLLYKACFTYWKPEELVCAVSTAESRTGISRWYVNGQAVYRFFGAGRVPEKGGQFRFDLMDPEAPERKIAHKLYEELIPFILRVELHRGEQETAVSSWASEIQVLYGADTLVRILTALGREPLKRTYGFNFRGTDRQTVLCHLLRVCHPGEGETAADLGRALKGSGITRKRLAETAMYARQWIPLLEEYLGIPGFESGCYYFMAHTSEGIPDEVMSVISRYTPLTQSELYDGAFDVAWFRETYEKLGEKDFRLLYDAAKYSAIGSAHARARKYADAALGNTTFEALSAAIREKRNKDLLMSLPLLPLAEEQEEREHQLLWRYQLIQEYGKESRQFGAQRRASERRAAETALRNLSINAGFSDVTRLKLRMEGRLQEEAADCLKWQQVEDVMVRVLVDETGKSSLECQKDGKSLKSIPAKYKKQEPVVRCQQVHKRLKEQYQRTRQMFEQAMEDGTVFEAWELLKLMDHPVIRPILSALVFLREEAPGGLGFLEEAGLRDWSGQITPAAPRTRLLVAHPWDLRQDGHWAEYQKALFERKIRQPFRQVFRELYVKLPEELEKRESRLFAGHQIQPGKAAAVLRDRRWSVDRECGLLKIYYKENIAVILYALADWYSPGDMEAPTLEAVVFYDRKTWEELAIGQIPDRIYSEVMRDADLAVSTAYVGGVDPEAGHSTVEMRRGIIEGNLALFGITNVRLKENHALIDGTYGQYTVHLGSGVIHQTGNAMLNVLPVHSQQRGRIFLPFVDEDPKTAEILSKILMFAEDEKIRDPAVIRQIRT